MNELPPSLARAMMVSTFQASVVGKRALLETLYSMVVESRAKYEPLRDEVRRWNDGHWIDFAIYASVQSVVQERDALRASYEDAAAALLLIAAASLERLHKALKEPLFERGALSYVPSIRLSRAIWVIALQYKHLGQWIHESKVAPESAEVEALVGDRLRTDAAAEFLNRCGFGSYDQFETALLSCIDGLTDRGLVPTGDSGVPGVTIRAEYLD